MKPSIDEMLASFEADSPNLETRIAIPGKIAQQGDLYLISVSDSYPHGPETMDRQLAAGTTKGSRHVAQGTVHVYLGTTHPEGVNARQPLGPLVVAEQSWELDHPEHPNWTFPAGSWQVVYQLNALNGQAVED
jgi:hypothetical protein